jgi:hypothetical protein
MPLSLMAVLEMPYAGSVTIDGLDTRDQQHTG